MAHTIAHIFDLELPDRSNATRVQRKLLAYVLIQSQRSTRKDGRHSAYLESWTHTAKMLDVSEQRLYRAREQLVQLGHIEVDRNYVILNL